MSDNVSNVRCGEKVLSFACDWGVGIGGARWSTGLELVQHFQMFPALYANVFRGKTVVELGTGTGLVGECVLCMRPLWIMLRAYVWYGLFTGWVNKIGRAHV